MGQIAKFAPEVKRTLSSKGTERSEQSLVNARGHSTLCNRWNYKRTSKLLSACRLVLEKQ
jgi:hypothetical protein